MSGTVALLAGDDSIEAQHDLHMEKLKERLLVHAEKFIKEQRISCKETIYQTDWVIENAYEFIEGVCNIVGFHNEDKDAIERDFSAVCRKCGR